jgi:hypothetical protein
MVIPDYGFGFIAVTVDSDNADAFRQSFKDNLAVFGNIRCKNGLVISNGLPGS